MNVPTKTRVTLLFRLRDPADREAWNQFVDLYCPLIRRYLLRRGLQETDADDLVQEVFCTVSQYIQGFEHRSFPGSFRAWLRKITCCRLHEFLAQRARQVRGSGDTGVRQQIEQCPASQEYDPDWEADCHRRMLQCAAGQIRGEFRDTTWQAFWRTAVKRISTEDTARDLGISKGAVYIARSRVFTRLQQAVREIDEEVHAGFDLETLTQ